MPQVEITPGVSTTYRVWLDWNRRRHLFCECNDRLTASAAALLAQNLTAPARQAPILTDEDIEAALAHDTLNNKAA